MQWSILLFINFSQLTFALLIRRVFWNLNIEIVYGIVFLSLILGLMRSSLRMTHENMLENFDMTMVSWQLDLDHVIGYYL